MRECVSEREREEREREERERREREERRGREKKRERHYHYTLENNVLDILEIYSYSQSVSRVATT